MYGAMLGDMIGAPFEFDRGEKTKEFPLFGKCSNFTDDTVMTIAVAEALMDSRGHADEEVKAALVASMQMWGARYPHAGYGGMFRRWLKANAPQPYGSFGNGSAMRVAAVGWLYDTLEDTRRYARLSAEVTHNHPEGIKGAEATAAAIFLARTGHTKADIKDYIVREFGYDLTRTCDEIRPTYHHVESCQETVPEAITAFLEGTDFEDVIRTAVSLGGDCDTLTCIAGSIAEAFYGVPADLKEQCRRRLDAEMIEVLERFEGDVRERWLSRDSFLAGNEHIEAAIERYCNAMNQETGIAVLDAIHNRMLENGHLLIPVKTGDGEEFEFGFGRIEAADGQIWHVAFTSVEEMMKGVPAKLITHYIGTILETFKDMDSSGIVINPWGNAFALTKERIEMILQVDREMRGQ